MCGEKASITTPRSPSLGSPPLVRGKALKLFIGVCDVRITPACAGKRLSSFSSSPKYRDHPRLCGEKKSVIVGASDDKGSPPLVRGKVPTAKPRFVFFRITPACAGKRYLSILILSQTKDHPRLCGEKPSKSKRGRQRRGSPPLVRGKVAPYRHFRCCFGITPACAGKSGINSKKTNNKRDHPRLCGEK